METYIIRVRTKINGKFKTCYHENITPTKRKDVMNVYTEHLTGTKKKAKIFYDKEEAEKVMKMFSHEFSTGEVIVR